MSKGVRFSVRLLSLVLAAFFLGLGVSANAQTPSSTTDSAPLYRVGTGDRLKVSVYNVEKLTGEYLVGGDGKIAIPILGRVPVGGMTLDDIAAMLAAQLGNGYFINPNVTVDIAAYRPVYILGEVQRPGQYPFAEGMTVNRLVAAAGGFTYRANRKSMRVRRGADTASPGRVAEDGAVMPGDTIYVGERYF